MERESDDSNWRIRRAAPHESGLLSDLALRSKGHWGYAAGFLEACRGALTLSADYIAAWPVFVLEEAGKVVGFYGLRGLDGGRVELLYLFLEPTAINRGHGKRLWAHAVEAAARFGFHKLMIESDPHAESFYLSMGARRVGAAESSSQPGRMLPLLEFSCRS